MNQESDHVGCTLLRLLKLYFSCLRLSPSSFPWYAAFCSSLPTLHMLHLAAYGWTPSFIDFEGAIKARRDQIGVAQRGVWEAQDRSETPALLRVGEVIALVAR
jgi:hypothetical protein